MGKSSNLANLLSGTGKIDSDDIEVGASVSNGYVSSTFSSNTYLQAQGYGTGNVANNYLQAQGYGTGNVSNTYLQAQGYGTGDVSNNYFQDNRSATGSLYEFYTGLTNSFVTGTTTNQILKYNTLSYSEGTAGYNTSTGYWTAATAGIYMFNWVTIHQLNAGGGWGFKNGYYLNSTAFITEAISSDNAHKEYNSQGKIRHKGTAILKMAVNDTFRVFQQSDYTSSGTISFVSSGSTLQILRMT